MTAPPPSIGRIVHYCDHEGRCVAAMVVGLPAYLDGERFVDLTVFGRAGMSAVFGVFDVPQVEADEARAGEGAVRPSWHWPERVG
ncbi:hypothetical protein JOL79_06850 [Microbispora sp. RL4-1S]|uniref:Uncharacterized protein n=1 Tax=Microbispora oryzae TaxID=2806554 RepID=A0A940WDM4_9ACTN|nr:hypothetical protein [Microbispora oryzae]MBP2703516.1 hypothetical protein [Microbispora oryzae]